MSILALEASTSSAKAMLWDGGEILGVESAPYPADVSDGVTFSPSGVADTVLRCGAALLRRCPGARIEAVGLSSIWHSLVLLDGDGKPLGRGATWADTSPARSIAPFRADGVLAGRAYHATGCPVHSIYNAWKWMHAKQTQDVSAVRHISCLPEYLFYSLTDELSISLGAASGSAFLSAHMLDWDPFMLELTGVNRDMLGRLVEPHHAAPLKAGAAAALGLPAGVPVAATGPDGALNHIAAGGLGQGVMTLSVGTSGALRVAHAGPVIPQKQSTWCYYGAEGLRIVGAATSGAGNCVNWFVKGLLGGAHGFPGLEAAALASDRSSAPFFLPFLFGERSPGWDDARLGGFCGLSPDAGVGSMYYAVLEGVLFNLYQNYRILVETAGCAPEVISISGGITQSPLWMALAADTFGAELTENTGEHASLLGAVYMAQRALGALPSLLGIPVGGGRRHLPDRARHERIMARFEQWLDWYSR